MIKIMIKIMIKYCLAIAKIFCLFYDEHIIFQDKKMTNLRR